MSEKKEKVGGKKGEKRESIAEPANSIEINVNELLQPFWRHGNNLTSMMAGWPNAMPSMDIVDNGDSFTVKADMPGVDKKNIKLKVTRHGILISAEKADDREQRGKNYYYRERSSAGYHREMAFPEDVKSESAKAKYENGILTVEIKKVAPKAPAEIDVNIE